MMFGKLVLGKQLVTVVGRQRLPLLATNNRLCNRWKHYTSRPQNGLSYISVSGEKPLIGLTIGQLLDQSAAEHGDSEGLVVKHQNIRRTYSQLKNETDDLAEGLLALGLQKGDRVGIWGTNSHEWYLTHTAVAKAGLILVSINPAYQSRELLYAINRVSIKAIVFAEDHHHQHYYEILASVVTSLGSSDPGRIADKNVPSLTTAISMASNPQKGTYSFAEVLSKGSESKNKELLTKISKSIQFDDIFNIQFTSGTTGNPKGVMLSHHNMVNNSYLVGRRFGYTPRDKLCLPVPMFHCYGQVVGMLSGLHNGSTCVFPVSGYDPQKTMAVAAEEKCTVLYGTPTMHVDMTNVPDLNKLDLSSLKLAITAGAIAPEDLVREMRKTYACKVIIVYGLTETSPAIYQTLLEDSDDLAISTVGYPHEHTEIKIVDSEGRTVPLGVEGEMLARGYMIMPGYWEEPQKTAESITSSRWFYTGDTFVMLESGHARIVGRVKDMIIRGGENIYPREIEEFLHQHPKIVEAHVFGIPDHRMGEEVGVWIRLKDGEELTQEELRAYCKGKISHFKIPRYILFRNDFPKTTSGKIQKFRMRDLTVEALGLKP